MAARVPEVRVRVDYLRPAAAEETGRGDLLLRGSDTQERRQEINPVR